jgi:hypothetical protein
MKPEQDDRLEAGGDFGKPGEFLLGQLQPAEIIGRVDNPVLETVRRLWWRALDRVCCCFALVRLSIHDRVHGSEPPAPADLKREADHKRLVRAFPEAGEAIGWTKSQAGQNRADEIGSPYS